MKWRGYLVNKDPRKRSNFDEEFADETTQRQIQEVYQDGAIDEKGAQINYSPKPSSVKGNKKTNGPNFPAT